MATEAPRQDITDAEKGEVTPNTQHIDESNDSGHGDTEANGNGEKLETHRTISRVPGNPNYFEVGGLRTEGDGQDHSTYQPGKLAFIMTVLGCSLALCGSQITPLLYLTLSTRIALALDATDNTLWLLTVGIVISGAGAPLVGPICDLIGRKTLLLIGIALSMLGGIVCAATPNASGYLAGQAFLGFGTVTEELLAISIVAEIVPTAKRPFYSALILTSIIPWSPGTSYANWMAVSSWRWVGCTLAVWHAIPLVILWWFYRPPPRVNSMGLSKMEILKRIDFVGMAILTAGLLFFLVALNWGDQAYPWNSGHVLGFLVSGLVLLASFFVWEAYGAPYPLYPKRIVHAPRPFYCLMFVIFAAGINYVPLVVLWPIESIAVFQSDDKQTGINTLPIGICILGGAIISALLLGWFKKRVTLIMATFCIMQTVASACLTVIDKDDINTAWAPIVLALIGVGGVLVPNQVLITIITPDDLIGSVTALTVGLRAQAQVIGLAIFYNRFIHQVEINAVKYIAPAMINMGVFDIPLITQSVAAMTAVPLKSLVLMLPQLADPDNYAMMLEAVKQCFSQSFLLPYYITIAFGVPACIGAVFMGDLEKYFDSHVAVVL